MGNDLMAILAKEYVQRHDYDGAIAIVDSIAQRDTRKAAAVYRFAFHRTIGEIVRHAIFNFIDNHSGLWIMLESSGRGKTLLHRLAR
jgi:hypothetical protein